MNEKEFEKQQLEQLISDLKDIDKYTSFKNGAFIYDLGKYQGSLLVNHINNLQSKIDKVSEYCEEVIKEHNNREYNVSTVELAVKEHKENIENVLDILKEDK